MSEQIPEPWIGPDTTPDTRPMLDRVTVPITDPGTTLVRIILSTNLIVVLTVRLKIQSPHINLRTAEKQVPISLIVEKTVS